jgi:mannose-6-phosphate isomerase-like protein (cupin superfamily)
MSERINDDRRRLPRWVVRRRTIMRSLVSAAAALVLLSATLPGQSSTPAQPLHWIVPPLLPPGARLAVVSGDPTMPGRCSLQLSMPDGYRLPPHLHPVDETVEVKEGTLLVGTGDELDVERTRPLVAGDTGTAPAGTHHYSVAKGATIVSVTFMGPYTITYLHSYDVPRRVSFPYSY